MDSKRLNDAARAIWDVKSHRDLERKGKSTKFEDQSTNMQCNHRRQARHAMRAYWGDKI